MEGEAVLRGQSPFFPPVPRARGSAHRGAQQRLVCTGERVFRSAFTVNSTILPSLTATWSHSDAQVLFMKITATFFLQVPACQVIFREFFWVVR